MPSGDEYELRELGAPSIALSAMASKRLGGSPFILFGRVGFQYCTADDIAGIELHNEKWSGLAGLEYQYRWYPESNIAWVNGVFEPGRELLVQG